MRYLSWVMVCSALALQGCGVWGKTRVAAGPDPVDTALLEVAQAVKNDARRYGPVRHREVMVPASDIEAPMDGPLREPIDLHFAGDILPISRAIASFLGWTMEVEGVPRPVLVRVEAVGTPVGRVLRDVGVQAGNDALLVVDAAQGQITVSFSDWRVSR